MIMGNNEEAVYDNGFNDTGVTRSVADWQDHPATA